MKKGILFTYHRQIDAWKKQHNVIAHLLRSRIQDFYSENGIYINTLLEDCQRLKADHLVLSAEGMPTKGEDGKLLYQEGKTEYSFNKNWDVLMEQQAGAKFTIETYTEPTPEPVADATEGVK